ncbi:cupin domain-containing protein [Sneathiella litorea]|uniref:Cupin domain-containing protein n=1 Tax=Sneathiella litorea TaxID=2606216 RepID=A0A6L8W779_9PROT|nr:cupin domain-containing protein [Sneathiella litorea]MZR30382.1 cupin domain-containing protein [Sneathiella litorea]
MREKQTPRKAVLNIAPAAGRRYEMGGMTSYFLADEEETSAEYSISEWWLEPHQAGSGPHSHETQDDMFFVLEGVMTFFIDGKRIEAPKGTFLRAPAGIEHDFENSSDVRAGFLNIQVSGGFERDMPAIVRWFVDNPPEKD